MDHWHTLGALAADHRTDLARDAAGGARLRAAGRPVPGRKPRRWAQILTWAARAARIRPRQPVTLDATTRVHAGTSGMGARTIDVAPDVR